MSSTSNSAPTAAVRPVLQALARVIASDRRAVILATAQAEVLLSNAAAGRLNLCADTLLAAFDWATLCTRARRAGTIAASARLKDIALEGELVHLSLGPTDTYLLRLAETDQEAALLRNRSRTATLLRVSHDLRTPIQSLLSAADAVFDAPEAEVDTLSARRDRMKRAAERALHHIDDVIKVIRGDLAPGDLHADEEFNLLEEVRGILEMVEPIAKARGAEVRLAQTPEQEIRVRGSLRLVRALLQNMIDNSVKHGGARIDVALTCQRPDPMVSEIAITVEVADLGGGLSEAQKSRLQGALPSRLPQSAPPAGSDKDSARPSAGLTVLTHALTQLGGRMEVLDRHASGAGAGPVEGTVLRAHFALQIAEAGVEAGEAVGTVLAGASLLVVEDSPSSREWLVATLRQNGAMVEAVGNGAKALALLKDPAAADQIDLLLTDMTLPQMSGIELVKRIREGQATGEIVWQGKMLGLTAHVDARLRQACMALGMVQLLEKPIRRHPLCQSIRDALALAPSQATDSPQPDDSLAQDSAPALGREAVAELINHMSFAGAKRFLLSARAEAQAALDDIRTNGLRHDTARMLHAATGASGLTGLTLLEQRLRALELAVEQPEKGFEAECAALEAALAATSAAIDQLG